VHSWIFRQRRRLEQLYGLPPGRPEPLRLGAGHPAPRAPEPAGRPARPTGKLEERVLVPAPRRVA